MMLALAATAVSVACIVALCVGDPKRRRSMRLQGQEHGAVARRSLTVTACLPGVLCAGSGDAAAFLLWLGGTAAIGWLATLWFARRDAARD